MLILLFAIEKRQREAEAQRQREAEAQRQRKAEAQRQREAEAQRQREERRAPPPSPQSPPEKLNAPPQSNDERSGWRRLPVDIVSGKFVFACTEAYKVLPFDPDAHLVVAIQWSGPRGDVLAGAY